MSPDLEWRVDDQSGKQTIAQTTPPRSPRWRGIVIGLVVCLGIGLGVVYTSLPESPKLVPAPAPTPSPASPAMPVALYQTIVREATALQTGQSSELNDLLDAEDQLYQPYQSGSGNFQRWGRPRTGSLFTIEDFGFLADDRAWVDVSQYREGHIFHEMRFYRLRNGLWKRTEPDAALWIGQPGYVATVHFRIQYWPFDQQVVPALAARLEHDYEQLCTDLECDISSRQCVTALDQEWCSSFTTSPTLTLLLRGYDSPQMTIGDAGPYAFLQLSSPRITGFYDKTDPLLPVSWAISSLLIQQAAYGQVSFSGSSQNGEVLIAAIGNYALARLQAGDKPLEDYWMPTDLNIKNPPPLSSLWEKPDPANTDRMFAEASALIRYIEQTYGWPTVVKLLKSIRRADSMTQLIELSLDLPLADFEPKWRAWVKSYVPRSGMAR